MKNSLVQQCLEILKRDDVKNECKLLLKPVFDFIFYEIQPYIYIIVGLVLLIFVMNLAILILLLVFLRKNVFLFKNTG